jgi:hypothetical protein
MVNILLFVLLYSPPGGLNSLYMLSQSLVLPAKAVPVPSSEFSAKWKVGFFLCGGFDDGCFWKESVSIVSLFATSAQVSRIFNVMWRRKLSS